MWRLIKAELTYKLWEPLGIYAIGWLLAVGFWKFVLLIAVRSARPDFPQLGYFVAFLGIIFPYQMTMLLFLNREFKEFRIRGILPIPVSLKDVATTRLLPPLLIHFVLTPISLAILIVFNLATPPSFASKFSALSLITLVAGLYYRLIPELQYLSRQPSCFRSDFLHSSSLLFFPLCSLIRYVRSRAGFGIGRIILSVW